MAFTAITGPLWFSELDAIHAGLGTASDAYILRRLTDTRFIFMRNHPTAGGITRGSFVLCDLGEGTFSTSSIFAGVENYITAFCTLSDGRFITLQGSPVVARLYSADGALQSTLTLEASISSQVTADGDHVFLWVGDTYAMAESSPGTVIVLVSGASTDTGNPCLLGYQMTVGSSTLTRVGTGRHKMMEGTKAYYGMTSATGNPPISPKHGFAVGNAVVGAVWGTRNVINVMYAVGASPSGPVKLWQYNPGSNVRLLQPDMRATATGMLLYGQNDIWGSGNPGSGAEGDLLLTVDFSAGAGFTNQVGTYYSNTLRGGYVMEDHLFETEAWPSYQAAVGQLDRVWLINGGGGASTDYLKMDEYDVADRSETGIGTWNSNGEGGPFFSVPVPTTSPYVGATYTFACDESLSTTKGVVILKSNGTGVPKFAAYIFERADPAPYPLAVADRGRRARFDPV